MAATATAVCEHRIGLWASSFRDRPGGRCLEPGGADETNDAETLGCVELRSRSTSVRPQTVLAVAPVVDPVQVQSPGVSQCRRQVRRVRCDVGKGDGDLGDPAMVDVGAVVQRAPHRDRHLHSRRIPGAAAPTTRRPIENRAEGVELEVEVEADIGGVRGEEDLDAVVARHGIVALGLHCGHVSVLGLEGDVERFLVPRQSGHRRLLLARLPPREGEGIDDGGRSPGRVAENPVDGRRRHGDRHARYVDNGHVEWSRHREGGG